MERHISFTTLVFLILFCPLFTLPVSAEITGEAIGNAGDGQNGYHSEVPAGEGCDGGYDVGGAGHDIWLERDGFYFMYETEPFSGNFDATCRIESFINPGPGADHEWGKVGIMARNSTAAGSVNNYIAVNLGNPADNTNRRLCMQGRDVADNASWSDHDVSFTTPISVRLVRTGTLLQSFYRYSPDETWTIWRTHTTENLADDVLLGIAVTNHKVEDPPAPFEARVCDLSLEELAAETISDLSVTTTETGIELSWNKPVDFDHYMIERIDAAGRQVLDGDVDGTAVSFLDTTDPAAGTRIATYIVTPYSTNGKRCLEATGNRYLQGVVSNNGYILSWLLLGPFMTDGPDPSPAYLRDSFIFDGLVTEETICPYPGLETQTDFTQAAPLGLYTVSEAPELNPNGIPTWYAYHDGDWIIDLDTDVYNANVERTGTVACTYVINTTADAIPVVMGTHSDDSIYLALNNEELVVSSKAGGWGTEGTPQAAKTAKLLPGYNKVLVKVADGDWGNGFAVRMAHLDGTPVTHTDGISISMMPEMDGIPQAELTVEKGPGEFDVTVSAVVSHCGGKEITSFAWDMDGDGTTDDTTAGPVTFTYPEPGEYFISLSMTDEDGTVGNAATRMIFEPPPPEPTENFCDEFDEDGDPLESGYWTLDDPSGLVGAGVSLNNTGDMLIWTNDAGVNTDNWCGFDYTPKLLVNCENRDYSFETQLEITQQSEQWRQIGLIMTWDSFPDQSHLMWGLIRDHLRIEQCEGFFSAELLDTQFPGGACEPCGYTVFLRVDKIDNEYVFSYKTDDADPWSFGAATTFDAPPSHIGIMGKNWSGVSFTTQYEYACLGDPDPSLWPTGTGETTPFSDDFEDTTFDPITPPAPWLLDDPNGYVTAGNISIACDGESLNYIGTEGTNTDNWCGFQNSANLYVEVGEMEQWAFETRVTVNSRGSTSVQAGIIFDWNSFPGVPNGQVMYGPLINDLGIEGCGVVPGDRIRLRQGEFATTPHTISLKAQRDGTLYSFFYRDEDTESWVHADSVQIINPPDMVALFGKTWGDSAFNLSFDYARLSEELEDISGQAIDPDDYTGFGVTGQQYLRSVALTNLTPEEISVSITPDNGSTALMGAGGTLRFTPAEAGTYTLRISDSSDGIPTASCIVEIADNLPLTDSFDGDALVQPWTVVNPGPSGAGQPQATYGVEDGRYRAILPSGGHFDEWGDAAGNITWHNALQLVRTDIAPEENWIIEVKNDMYACRTEGFRDANNRASHQGPVVGFYNTTDDANPDNDYNWFCFGELDDFSNQQILVAESMGQSLFGSTRALNAFILHQPVTYRVRKEGNRYSFEYKDPDTGLWEFHGSGTVDPSYVPVYVGIMHKKWGTLSEYETTWDSFTITPYSPTCPTMLVCSSEGRTVTCQWNGMNLTDLSLSVDGGAPVTVPDGAYAYQLVVDPGDHTISLSSAAGGACGEVTCDVSVTLRCPADVTACVCGTGGIPSCGNCSAESNPNDVRFTWTNADLYDAVEVFEIDDSIDPPQRTRVAEITDPGDAGEIVEYTIEQVIPAGAHRYVLVFNAGEGTCESAAVGVEVPSTGTYMYVGDSNNDGQVNIADAVFMLAYLFAGGEPPACAKACDTNDDGGLNIADAVAELAYLFAGNPLTFPDGSKVAAADHPGCAQVDAADIPETISGLPGCETPCIP